MLDFVPLFGKIHGNFHLSDFALMFKFARALFKNSNKHAFTNVLLGILYLEFKV